MALKYSRRAGGWCEVCGSQKGAQDEEERNPFKPLAIATLLLLAGLGRPALAADLNGRTPGPGVGVACSTIAFSRQR